MSNFKTSNTQKAIFLILFFIFLLFAFEVFAAPAACKSQPDFNAPPSCEVTIIYSDTGEGSGLNQCLYRVESAGVETVPWTSAGTCSGPGPVDLTVFLSIGSGQDCRHSGTNACTIYSKAIDVAGNESAEDSKSYNIDFISPTTTIECNGTICSTGWYNTDISITLSCLDSHSGCDKIYYCIDQTNSCSPTTEYIGAFNITTEGTNYVRYYSTDIAGNVEPTNSKTIKLDKTLPTGTLTVTPDSPEVGQDITITITAQDGESGVDYLLAKDDDSWLAAQGCGGASPCTKSWIVQETVVGDHTYCGLVYDLATNFNWATPQCITVTVSAPTHTLTISSTAGGSVTDPGEGVFTYNEGEVVNLLASPDSGYHFVNWTGDTGTITDPNSASTNITMNSDYSITANFEVVNLSPQLESISVSPDYVKQGDTITVNSIASDPNDGDNIRLECGSSPESNDLCISDYTLTNPSCFFASPWPDNTTHTIYCRAYDGELYSEERTDTITSDNTGPIVGEISPTEVAKDQSQTYTFPVSDLCGADSCVLQYVDGEIEGLDITLSDVPCQDCTASFPYTFSETGTHTFQVMCDDLVDNATVRIFNIEVSEIGPLICNINVPDTRVINQWIEINVSGSQGAIVAVRFSSDDNLNDNPDGTWNPLPPNYYDWGASEGNWDHNSKTMKWSFVDPGIYEVWAEVKDSGELTDSDYDTITIFECYPGQEDTCISDPWGCTHIIRCTPQGTWPPCPEDECVRNTEDDVNCPCPGIDVCVGSDYYDYPEYGSTVIGFGNCNSSCTCDIGMAPGQPCAPIIYPFDPHCTYCGDGHCDSGETIWNCCPDCGIPESGCEFNLRYWYTCDNHNPTKHTEDCGSDSWTENYQCSADNRYVQREYCERGCQDASCYENCYWLDWQDCDSWDGCVDADYYDYSCSGAACVAEIFPEDPRCIHGDGGHDQCNTDEDCEDGNPCTDNKCERPDDPDSICYSDNVDEGISCGICEECDGSGNCVNRPDDYDTDECGLGCQRCVSGSCQDYNAACDNIEESCECIADECRDCSNYYGEDCGYQGICFCGPLEIPSWSCVGGNCQCVCQYDPSCEWVPDGYPEVIISPPSQEGNPGDELFYEVIVINPSGEETTLTVTASVPPDWDYWLDTLGTIDVTIGPGESVEIPLRVKSPGEDVPSGEYIVSVTAQNEDFGTGYATYEVLNSPPSATNLSASPEGICFLIHPFVRLSWTFDDPDLASGDYQSAREVEIFSDPGYTNLVNRIPEPDLSPGSTEYTPNTGLSFNTDYYWRVRVWDNEGALSDCGQPEGWCYPEQPSFHTEKEWPWPDFSVAPPTQRVHLKERVEFTDESTCYDGPCNFSPTANYLWEFGDGGTSSEHGNTSHIYLVTGNYDVTLSITDTSLIDPITGEFAVCITDPITIAVTLPLPEWMEIPPF